MAHRPFHCGNHLEVKRSDIFKLLFHNFKSCHGIYSITIKSVEELGQLFRRIQQKFNESWNVSDFSSYNRQQAWYLTVAPTTFRSPRIMSGMPIHAFFIRKLASLVSKTFLRLSLFLDFSTADCFLVFSLENSLPTF